MMVFCVWNARPAETIVNASKVEVLPKRFCLNTSSLGLTDIYAIITYYLWSAKRLKPIWRGKAAWRRPASGERKHGHQRE
jgi:hypothetical protein